MEDTVSRYEDILNDFAVAAVLAAAAYTDENLEHIVDQHWSKNHSKEDIIRMVCESMGPKEQKSFRKRML